VVLQPPSLPMTVGVVLPTAAWNGGEKWPQKVSVLIKCYNDATFQNEKNIDSYMVLPKTWLIQNSLKSSQIRFSHWNCFVKRYTVYPVSTACFVVAPSAGWYPRRVHHSTNTRPPLPRLTIFAVFKTHSGLW
jgi:hypothetical protein